jgi:hypothetical protein
MWDQTLMLWNQENAGTHAYGDILDSGVATQAAAAGSAAGTGDAAASAGTDAATSVGGDVATSAGSDGVASAIASGTPSAIAPPAIGSGSPELAAPASAVPTGELDVIRGMGDVAKM